MHPAECEKPYGTRFFWIRKTLTFVSRSASFYRVDYVLTNPPFGKKSSITMTNEEGEEEEEDLVYNRQDFWTTSSNKQLNFIQHINTILNATGKAAVVVPDNVLFEGGAGETMISEPTFTLHSSNTR